MAFFKHLLVIFFGLFQAPFGDDFLFFGLFQAPFGDDFLFFGLFQAPYFGDFFLVLKQIQGLLFGSK